MPYALCPMPYAQYPIVPHVTEKGYIKHILIDIRDDNAAINPSKKPKILFAV
jgi:hypothetical protein